MTVELKRGKGEAMNSFQKWAISELTKVGIEAKPLANWVTFACPKGDTHTIMSEQGISDFISETRQPLTGGDS